MTTFPSKVTRALIILLALAVAAVTVVLVQRDPAEASTDRNFTLVFINRGENTVPIGTDFRFNSPLYRVTTGEVAGSDSGVCEQLPPRDGIVDEYVCDTVFTLNNGTITASGKQRITATTAIGAVTGGTGTFLGCDGTVTGTATGEPGVFKITLKLDC